MSATSNFHLLVVDDDALIADSIRLILPQNWRLTAVKNGKNLDEKMSFHAAFVDMHLRPQVAAEGPAIIAQLAQSNPLTEIVAMSGDLSIDLMELCLDKGAKKFLAKPLVPDEVLATLEKMEARWLMRTLEARGLHGHAQLIGKSSAMEQIRHQIAQLRGEPGPLLIEGETGTGKEVVTQMLSAQELSRPLISVNVAGIPEALFESEMFGHNKGAFTGADQMKIGLAEAASGGDLFLDEIEALPLPQQVKLLRFLETGEVRKVGAKEAAHVKTRVIFATNQKLETLVKEGKFREDLLFRISGKKIILPPLRDRLEDIDLLAPHFFNLLKPRTNKTFSPEAIAVLKTYSWPGNVRELKRICEQLATSCPLPIVRAEDIQRLLSSLTPSGGSSVSGGLDYGMGLSRLVENFEAQVIGTVLGQMQQDIDKTSEKLQISRSNLYRKIKDYGVQVGAKN